MSSDLRGGFLFFYFLGKRGEKGKDWEKVNVKEGFEGLYQMGDKSGIWRFYRRICKNIFYERGDKERERGVLERWKGEVIFF